MSGMLTGIWHFDAISSNKVLILKYFAMDVWLCGNAHTFEYIRKITLSCGLLKSLLCDSRMARYRD